MGIRQINAEILREAKEVLGYRGLHQADIQEWRTTPIEPHAGEDVYFLPFQRLYISVTHGKGKTAPLQSPAGQKREEGGSFGVFESRVLAGP